MTRKIAIIRGSYPDGYDSELEQFIASSITDWTEVSEEDYKLLQEACGERFNQYGYTYRHRGSFRILERPTDEEQFVADTVADYLAHVRKEKKRREEEKRQREEAEAERKRKRLQKKLEKEAANRKALYEQLKEEFEGEESSSPAEQKAGE